MLERKGIQIVLTAGWIEQIRRHHGIERQALHCDTVAREHNDVVLCILAILLNRAIGQHWLQCSNQIDSAAIIAIQLEASEWHDTFSRGRTGM